MLQFLEEEARTKGVGHWRSSAGEALEPDLESHKGQPREAIGPHQRDKKDYLRLAFITEHKKKKNYRSPYYHSPTVIVRWFHPSTNHLGLAVF